MQVGSAIELYLTAYGWHNYGLLYLLFVITGIVYYPFGKLIISGLLDQASAYGQHTGNIREMLVKLLSLIAVAILTIVPMVPLDSNAAKMQATGCKAYDAKEVMRSGAQFGGSTYIPLLPYFAMSLAAGSNSAVLSNMQCMKNVVDANRASNSINITNLNLPDGSSKELLDELTHFQKECYLPALDRASPTGSWASGNPERVALLEALSDKYATAAANKASIVSNEGLKWAAAVGKGSAGLVMVQQAAYTKEINRQTAFYRDSIDGQFFREAIYSNQKACAAKTPGNYKNTNLTQAWADFCLGGLQVPSLAGVTASNKDVDPSVYQTNTHQQPIQCGDWWDGNGVREPLRDRVAEAAYIAKRLKENSEVLHTGGAPINDDGSEIGTLFPTIAALKSEAKGLSDLNKANLVDSVRNNLNEQSQLLSNGERITIASALVVGSTLDAFGMGPGIVKQMVTFYGVAYMTTLLLRITLPMLLMTIYILWAAYMIVGEYSGRTAIKGMMIIFFLKFTTAIWAIIDQVGSQLAALLYPLETAQGHVFDTTNIDFAIIYGAQALFYLAVPSILFWVISSAGGVGVETNTGYRTGAGGPSANLGNQIGQGGGGTGSSAARQVRGQGKGAYAKYRNLKGK